LPDLYIADILRDTDTLIEARQLAKAVFQQEGSFKEVEEALQNQFDDRFARIFYA